MLVWWGDAGSNVKTNDASVVGDMTGFSILPGSDDVYNAKTGQWDKLASGPNFAPNCAYIGWGVYVMSRVDSDEKKKKAAWSAAAHLGGKDLSLWCAAYPSGFQPYRNSHFNIPEWVAAGYDEAFISSYLKSEADSYNHPERRGRTAHPRHLPVLFRGRGRAGENLRGPEDGPARRRRHCGRMGEDHRPARPGEPDQALQGLARHVSQDKTAGRQTKRRPAADSRKKHGTRNDAPTGNGRPQGRRADVGRPGDAAPVWRLRPPAPLQVRCRALGLRELAGGPLRLSGLGRRARRRAGADARRSRTSGRSSCCRQCCSPSPW